MTLLLCQSDVNVKFAFLLIQDLLGAYFIIKKWNSLVSKKTQHYLCKNGIEKSVPLDHRLSSVANPGDVN